MFRSVCELVGTFPKTTERGLESCEQRAWSSCSANLLTSVEEHLSNGVLDVNLLKYFALKNAVKFKDK